MPMLHVAGKIDEAALSAGATGGAGVAAPACTFRIPGGAPGAKVSWRVEALRNDLWVQKRGMPVEVEKQGREKGTYQHPELYGLSAEMGMDHAAPAQKGPRQDARRRSTDPIGPSLRRGEGGSGDLRHVRTGAPAPEGAAEARAVAVPPPRRSGFILVSQRHGFRPAPPDSTGGYTPAPLRGERMLTLGREPLLKSSGTAGTLDKRSACVSTCGGSESALGGPANRRPRPGGRDAPTMG